MCFFLFLSIPLWIIQPQLSINLFFSICNQKRISNTRFVHYLNFQSLLFFLSKVRFHYSSSWILTSNIRLSILKIRFYHTHIHIQSLSLRYAFFYVFLLPVSLWGVDINGWRALLSICHISLIELHRGSKKILLWL